MPATSAPITTARPGAGWSWREWFCVAALLALGLLVCATDSAWGLVVAVPAALASGLGLYCELAARRS